MFRGTTPTIFFSMNNLEDLSEISEVWISIHSMRNKIQKTIKDVAFDFENKIIILELSQKETLSLSGNHVDIQLRILLKDGSSLASKIMKMPLEQILRPGIISAEEDEEIPDIEDEDNEDIIIPPEEDYDDLDNIEDDNIDIEEDYDEV